MHVRMYKFDGGKQIKVLGKIGAQMQVYAAMTLQRGYQQAVRKQ